MSQTKPNAKVRAVLSILLFAIFLAVKNLYALIQPSIAAQASVEQIKDSVISYNLARMFITGDPIGTLITTIFLIGIVCIWWGYISYHVKKASESK